MNEYHAETVLAQIPDVTTPPEPPAPQSGAPQREGRVLSPGLSARILLGGGLALFLIAAMPFFFGRKDPASSASREETPVFQPKPPAPDAPLAPKWEGKTAQTLREEPAPAKPAAPAKAASGPKTEVARGRGDPAQAPHAPTSRHVAVPPAPGPAPGTAVPSGPWRYPSTDDYPAAPAYADAASYPSTDDYPRREDARQAYPRAVDPRFGQAAANRRMSVEDPGALADRYAPRGRDPRSYGPALDRRLDPNSTLYDPRAAYDADRRAADAYDRAPRAEYGDAYYPPRPSPRVADLRQSYAPPPSWGGTGPVEEPGVARLRGTIEKPTARSPYDGARSGVY